MALPDELRQQFDDIIGSDAVVLFMKGVRNAPQCGFSATVVQILDEYLPDYTTINVLSDPALREGIKEYSDWPTIPQLYVKGQFIGGCDIVRELHDSKQLARSLGDAVTPAVAPSITVTDAAAGVFRKALAEAGDSASLRLGIDPGFNYDLGLGERGDGDVVAESNGIAITFDPASARRAEGLVIDHVSEPQPGFKMDNPNEPPQVQPMTAQELKAKLDADEELRLIDVRNEAEREVARIEGAQLLDEGLLGELLKLPKDTTLVFHCHHGMRSHQAAAHFIEQGFLRVYNLVGGIQAWSKDVDPSVPTY